MHDLEVAADDLLSHFKPDTVLGATVYLILFLLAALLLTRVLRAAVRAAMTRPGHLDRTTISFLEQVSTAAIWVLMLTLYAHLIPVLRSIGTALLAGASIASVVIGLAAQSTLGNLVAGVAITLYRPFRLGDSLQVSAPTGTEVGTVELISLGYTTLRTADGRLVVLPNSLAASQVAIKLSAAPAQTVAPLAITIHVGRHADIESARQAALRSAAAAAGESAVVGCFLTRIDASGATLELRVRAAEGERDPLRSQLVQGLAQRFAASGLDSAAGEPAAFS